MELDYKRDMRIDESALDVEWLEQAALAIKYGRYWAKCKSKVDQLEEMVKVVRSELVNQAYANPDKYLGAGNKPTAVNVEAFFRTHRKHLDAKNDLLLAQEELLFAEIAKNEISFTRKTALENLVKLHGQQYFAGPKVPRDIAFEKRNRDATRTTRNARIRLNK